MIIYLLIQHYNKAQKEEMIINRINNYLKILITLDLIIITNLFKKKIKNKR
jgi:hypothetical protein